MFCSQIDSMLHFHSLVTNSPGKNWTLVVNKAFGQKLTMNMVSFISNMNYLRTLTHPILFHTKGKTYGNVERDPQKVSCCSSELQKKWNPQPRISCSCWQWRWTWWLCCLGIDQPIILYTLLWLKMKPQATTYIEAPLPEDCQMDSLLEDSTLSGMGTDSQSPDDNSVVVLPQQKRRSSGSTAPENKKRHVNNTPVKINVAQSLEWMSADKKERFMKKQEIAKERSGFEAEKVGILRWRQMLRWKYGKSSPIFFMWKLMQHLNVRQRGNFKHTWRC